MQTTAQGPHLRLRSDCPTAAMRVYKLYCVAMASGQQSGAHGEAEMLLKLVFESRIQEASKGLQRDLQTHNSAISKGAECSVPSTSGPGIV